MKFLVIGIDAFSFRMVERMKNDFISNLINNSQYGISISDTKYTDVPHTGPNWTCLYTGVSSDVHGITDGGWTLDNKNYSDIKVNTIFDIIDEKYNQSLMTLPLTYPAFEVNGWMISGFPTPNSLKDCYYPEEIENYLEDDFMISYEQCTKGMGWGSYGEDKKLKLGQTFLNLAKKHVKTFKKIYSERPTDFSFVGLTYVDRMNHLFTQQEKEIDEAYFTIFDMIEELIDFCNPENLVICSDHGFMKDKCTHDKYGFYLIKSDKFEKGRKDISITEVAPSILKILDIDEKLGKKIKREKKNLNKKQEKEMKERLKALGYI